MLTVQHVNAMETKVSILKVDTVVHILRYVASCIRHVFNELRLKKNKKKKRVCKLSFFSLTFTASVMSRNIKFISVHTQSPLIHTLIFYHILGVFITHI